ncbi:MAG: hypothetical protein VW258_08545 [Thalassolituus sp.]
MKTIVVVIAFLLYWPLAANAFDIHYWVSQTLIMPEQAAAEDMQKYGPGYLGLRLGGQIEVSGSVLGIHIPVRAINAEWCEYTDIRDYPAVLERARHYTSRYNQYMSQHLNRTLVGSDAFYADETTLQD